MKKQRLMVRILPIACLFVVLLILIAENTISQPACNIDDTYINSTGMTTKRIPAREIEVREQVDLQQIQVSAKETSDSIRVKESNAKNSVTELGAVASDKVAAAIEIVGKTEETIYVNQSKTLSLGNVYVGGVLVSPVITNVTSSNPALVAYIPSGAIDGALFTIKGLKTGKVTLTVKYTVMDGNQTLSGTRDIAVTCIDSNYYDTSVELSSPRFLLPTQTAEYIIQVTRSYYNSNGEGRTECDMDLSGCHIVVQPEGDAGSLVTTELVGKNLFIKAKDTGSGKVNVFIEKDGQVIVSKAIDFNIQSERYLIEYNGPKELYTNQIVSGPVLNHYNYNNGKLSMQTIEDAVITCCSDTIVVYKDKRLTAINETKSGIVTFRCEYNDIPYSKQIYFKVCTPTVTHPGLLYKGESMMFSLTPSPVIADDCTLTWTVSSKSTYGEEECATLIDNKDGTATLTCSEEGSVTVTATIKRGNNILCTSKQTSRIFVPVGGLMDQTGMYVYVNERSGKWGTDYKEGNTFYDTSITGVKSSDTSILQVLQYSKTYEKNHYEYTFYYKGVTPGKASVIISYVYIDKEGKPIAKNESFEVTVYGDYYNCSLNVEKTSVAPGESLTLGVKVTRSGYGLDEKRTVTEVTPTAVEYELTGDPSNIAEIHNGKLIFMADAEPGATVTVKATATADGKQGISGYQKFKVVSTYYKLTGITDNKVYLRVGDKKELSPMLYQYDKNNALGKAVENPQYAWGESDQSGSYSPSLTNAFFTITDTSIIGSKVGEAQVILVGSNKDDSTSGLKDTMSITVVVIPKDIPSLEVSQRGQVSYSGSYFKITPNTTGLYRIQCSNETSSVVVKLLDQNLKEVGSYTLENSAYSGYLSVPVSLKANETYYICGKATDKPISGSPQSYSLCIEPGGVAKKISQCVVSLSAKEYTYNGSQQKSAVIVKDGTKTLNEGTDYLLYYNGDLTNAGTYTITINGKGNYSGSVINDIEIKPTELTAAMLQPSVLQVIGNGKVQKPELVVKNGERTLVENTDYTIYYAGDFTTIGKHLITITGMGNYRGAISKTFSIRDKIYLTTCTVALSKGSSSYSGKEQKPGIIVKNGTIPLTVNKDYTVIYEGTFKNPGKYKITVKGKGNYLGSKVFYYTITKLSKTLAFTKTSISKKYGYKPFSLALTKASVKTVTYASSNTKVAKVDKCGKVTIVGAGKAIITAAYAGDTIYNGAKTYCTITVAKINNSITASSVTKTTSSKKQTFSLKVSNKAKITIKYSSNNKAVSIKSGKVTIAKNFVGKATITLKTAANTNFNAATKTITITVNPAGTKIKSLKKKSKNKFLLKWSKNSKASGYEIQYSTSKNFKKAIKKTIKKSGTTSYTASSLRKKTKYYVRIRTYKTVGKVRFYSGWSTIKSVKN